jgi:uncharacterized protein YdaU (DUF1376 family)
LGAFEESALHYYQFHIGDYRAATAHLSNDEDLAYRRLLDMYYDTEKPIPIDTQWVSRRLRLASETVTSVLRDMFVFTEDGWTHSRCDAEIEHYHHLAEKNRENGKKGGRPKKPSGLPLATDSEPKKTLTNNHEPTTINQDIEPKGSLSEAGLPTCPHEQILILWKKHLPHLTQPRSWEGSRKTNLRQRWLQAAKPSAYSPEGYKSQSEGLTWWESFFSYIAKETTLANGFQSQGRTWLPDLEWVKKSLMGSTQNEF